MAQSDDSDSRRSFDGKHCLVTGGAQGIGRAIALTFAARGAEHVVLVDRNHDLATEVAAEVGSLGAAATVVYADLSVPAEAAGVVDRALAATGALDILVNNAGVIERSLTERTATETLDEEVWDFVFNVNVKAPWLLIKAAGPHMRNRGGAAIVNCASVSGLTGYPESPAYCSSKGALIQLTRAAAVDLAPDVRVNAVCPGSTATPLREGFLEVAPDREAAERMMAASALLPRACQPTEVADLVAFLASAESTFINGAIMPIDGGSLAWRGSN